MKHIKSIGFIFVSLAASTLVVVLVFVLSSNLLTKSTPASDSVTCPRQGPNHLVNITNSRVVPALTRAKLCDKLTILNQDNVIRLLAFGTHDHHTPYDGVSEKILDKNQSLSVVLNQAGKFTFHDHIQEYVSGSFIVKP